jgi:hypothetical protein
MPDMDQVTVLESVSMRCRQFAQRILMRGWGSPDSPAEKKPLLAEIPAGLIIEAGSPHPFRGG